MVPSRNVRGPGSLRIRERRMSKKRDSRYSGDFSDPSEL